MSEGTRLILALVIGLGVVIFLIMKSKVQAFPALLISAVTVGLIGGLSAKETMDTIAGGFGSTLSSIGIVIGLGVMMGKILEVTGAAKKMAMSILKIVGVERTDLVLGLSGWLVSIPVFCDSGFVILSELAKEFSRDTKKSMVQLGCALGIGLYLTHHLVPPTPGPLAVAGIFGVTVGQLIIFGVGISLLMLLILLPISRVIASKNEVIIPERSKEALDNFNEDELPSGMLSFAPIVVPLILILMNTGLAALGTSNPIIDVVGNPICAVLIGLLIAVYGLTKGKDREEVVGILEDSLSDAGLIIMITGSGGALGTILRVSGIGDHVATLISQSGFPPLLVPLVMGSLLKLAQGSGTVAMITTAGIVAPMTATLGLNPLIGCLAVCIGPMCASYFNDSFFWVVTKFSGMSVETGIKSWTSLTAVSGLVGAVLLFILNIFIG
ncbi:MAG: GntP family permease [Tissierellia bacterium]|nr:GntP family permease [Tissierellia bacterium]